MDTLLTEMTNVNVGIMSMNGERGGGPVRYPVTPLDQTSCSDGEECDDILVYANIQSADDDTEETISTGVMQAGGNILSVRGQGTAVANQQLVGARFVDLDIPQGATITAQPSGPFGGTTPIQQVRLASTTAIFPIAIRQQRQCHLIQAAGRRMSSTPQQTLRTWFRKSLIAMVGAEAMILR
jgi:hypothetical protein